MDEFAEDHLDRYRTLEDYFQAKLGLVQTLSESGVFFVGEQIVSFKPKSFGWIKVPSLRRRKRWDCQTLSVIRSSLRITALEFFSSL